MDTDIYAYGESPAKLIQTSTIHKHIKIMKIMGLIQGFRIRLECEKCYPLTVCVLIPPCQIALIFQQSASLMQWVFL